MKSLKAYLAEFADDSTSPISGNNTKLLTPDDAEELQNRKEAVKPQKRKQHGNALVQEDWGSSDWTAAINFFVREVEGAKTADELASAAYSTASFYNDERRYNTDEWSHFSPRSLIRVALSRDQIPDHLIRFAVEILDGRAGGENMELDEADSTKVFFKLTSPRANTILSRMSENGVVTSLEWHGDTAAAEPADVQKIRNELIRQGAIDDFIVVEDTLTRKDWAFKPGDTVYSGFKTGKVQRIEGEKIFVTLDNGDMDVFNRNHTSLHKPSLKDRSKQWLLGEENED